METKSSDEGVFWVARCFSPRSGVVQRGLKHRATVGDKRVDDLDSVLKALRAEGVWVDKRVEESEYGKFGWIMDPEGNRLELWQAPVPKRKIRKATSA